MFSISSSLDGGLRALRVWTTLCCISVLERMRNMWLAGDGNLYAEEAEETIVDVARGWVERTLAPHSELALALESGALRRAASLVTADWSQTWEWRVGCVRREAIMTRKKAKAYMERTLLNVTRALASGHDTLKVFLSEPSDGLQRWESFMILVTLGASWQNDGSHRF